MPGRITTLLTALLLVTLLVSESHGTDYVENEMVCRVSDFMYLDSINTRYGTQVTGFLPTIGSYLLQAPPGRDADSLAAVISADYGPSVIIYCEANYILSAPEPVQGSQPFIDFDFQGDFELQAATRQLSLSAAQSVSTGSGVTVAVVDGGIDHSHPLFTSTSITGFDYVDNDFDPDDDRGGSATGHGTFVAGIIRLVAPDANLAAYRVLDTAGRGDGFTIAKAIVDAVFDGCRVINLSMVLDRPHAAVQDALEFARAEQAVVVAAAGNDSARVGRFPAADSSTLSVTAVDSVNIKADFANYHQTVTVSAPGVNVYGPYPDSSYAWWNGTSFAAPFVSGLAALLISEDPLLVRADVIDAIISSAIDIDSLNPDYAGQLGAGVIQPARSLGIEGPVCGDVNGDMIGPDIADLTSLVDFLFVTLTTPAGYGEADVNGSGDVDISDLTRMVNHLFVTGEDLSCAI